MQFLDYGTIFFIVAAVVIFLQLRAVLGRRTGNEKPPYDPFAGENRRESVDKADNVVALPRTRAARSPAAAPAPADHADIDALAPAGSELNDGLRAVRAADPSFNPGTFLEGARMAYEMIVTSFADGDRKTLKSLLSKDVFDGFVGAIAEREQKGLKTRSSFVGIDKAEIVGAEMKGSESHLTLRIASQLITSTVDAEGKVVEGDADNVASVKDVWTFARDTRSKDPNWKLVATEAED